METTNTIPHIPSAKTPHTRRTWIRTGAVVGLIAVSAGALAYWILSTNRVYVDSALVEAPTIDLAPASGGKVQQLFVNEGDQVLADAPIVQVGNELVKAKTAGIVISLPEQVGSLVAPGETVAEMIDPQTLRIVGKLDENKGLDEVAVGDRVVFTVDAFGSKLFPAVVDEVSPSSAQSGIVFNISNTRETQQFVIKARYDVAAYPELKNGMSARMWIYTRS